MPTIIAFDTSSDTASASLMVKGGHVHTRRSQGVSTHSQTLLLMVNELLSEAGLKPGEIDAVAFGCGPGSFTGVRTACGVAQGLAMGIDRPLVPVVSLLAMAETCRSENGATDVLAILDARMKEVYWAQYRYSEGSWQTVTAPRITPPESVLPVGSPVACGNGLIAYTEAFAALPVTAKYSPIMPDSAAMTLLAQAAFARGETIAVHDAQPLYLRNKVAYTTEERRVMKEGKLAC